jgi:hypothetical protein
VTQCTAQRFTVAVTVYSHLHNTVTNSDENVSIISRLGNRVRSWSLPPYMITPKGFESRLNQLNEGAELVRIQGARAGRVRDVR